MRSAWFLASIKKREIMKEANVSGVINTYAVEDIISI